MKGSSLQCCFIGLCIIGAVLAQFSQHISSMPSENLVPPPLEIQDQQTKIPSTTHRKWFNTAAQKFHLMPRNPRWFGFQKDSRKTFEATKNSIKKPASSTPYYYTKPYIKTSSGICNLCNQYPWLPMLSLPNYIYNNQYSNTNSDNFQILKSKELTFSNLRQEQNSVDILQEAHQQRENNSTYLKSITFSTQTLPYLIPYPAGNWFNGPRAAQFRSLTFNSDKISDILGAQSEIQLENTPSYSKKESNNDFEIIKSQQISDFVSSVEYPTTIIESHSIDVTKNQKHSHIDIENHKSVENDSFPSASTNNLTKIDRDKYKIAYYTSDANENNNNLNIDSNQLEMYNKNNDVIENRQNVNLELKHKIKIPVMPILASSSPITYTKNKLLLYVKPKENYEKLSNIAKIKAPESSNLSKASEDKANSIGQESSISSVTSTDLPFISLRPDTLLYGIKQQPRPFKTLNQVNHIEPSELVSSTEAITPTTYPTKHLKKIFASNLRDLLAHEHEELNFDIIKLQHNIDDWTQQEYSSLSHRPSTPTLQGKSKHIPSEYFTIDTIRSKLLPSLSLSINNLKSKIIGNETAVSFSKDLKYLSEDSKKMSNLLYGVDISTNQEKWESLIYRENSTDWDNVKLTISPQTNEKIYIVTPQPFLISQNTLQKNLNNTPSFRSPRFFVRPRPQKKSNFLYNPGLFGLMGLSTFVVPSKSVEIIDGNSKINKPH